MRMIIRLIIHEAPQFRSKEIVGFLENVFWKYVITSKHRNGPVLTHPL